MKNCLIHFDYGEIEFSVSKKDFNKVEVKNKIFINIFINVYPVYTSNQKFENSMNLLVISHKIKFAHQRISQMLCLIKQKKAFVNM